jgi:two-component system nitrogen regulation sensor histidine kinase NtrY
MNRPVFHITSLLAGALLILASVLINYYNTFTLNELAIKAGQRIEHKLDLCQKSAGQLLEPDTIFNNNEALESLYANEKIGLYLFAGDSLVYWNNSRIPFAQKPGSYRAKIFSDESGIVNLDYGYYLYSKINRKDTTALSLCLVKPAYVLQNNYLKNDFSEWTGIPGEISIEREKLDDAPVIVYGKTLFALKGNDSHYFDSEIANTCFLIFLSGFLLVLLAAIARIKNKTHYKEIVVWITLVPAVRLLMIWLKWPEFFYHTEFYNIQLFGNAGSFLNGYLGDILLNSIVLFFLASVFYFANTARPAGNTRILNIIVAFLLFFAIINQYNQNVISLVTNSTLNFDFLSIFDIKLSVFAALLAIAIYAFALYVAVIKTASLFRTKYWPDLLKFIGIVTAVCVLQVFVSRHFSFFENFWPLIFSLIIFQVVRHRSSSLLLALGLQILIMSAVTSRFLNRSIAKNQEKDLEILSYTLSEKQDAILESEFGNTADKISKDENLQSLIGVLPGSQEEVQQLLRQKYFGGYFDRYNIEMSLFDKDCHPLLPVNTGVLVNQGYFEDMIRYYSDSTGVDGLYFMKNHKKNLQYIGRIPIKEKMLFLLMEPKQFEELGSFPDLLLDQSQQKHEKLKNISHAVYRSRQTTSRYGEVNYPFFYQDSVTLARSEPGYIHHFFHPDDNTDIIISESERKWNYLFTFNSYLLLFFSLVTYIVYVIYASVFTNQFRSPSFTRRIQAIIILLLLLAMSAVGITSGRLVSGQFRAENKKQLEEKSRIIINELATQFKSSELFENTQKELVNFKLKEYSRLFNTPISLFDKNGYLYVTSEPKLYEFGLSAPLANPIAYRDLKNNQLSSEGVNEKAGTLKYLSFYTVLFDSKKQLSGFINLPYFARQSDLANELSGIISALINVYVFLFVLSIVAGLILSGYITQPLRLIKQQISNITLGKQNEKINWQSNDEIGHLVAEYNQMLVKLEDSAKLLAQSERESAWREMAKQVAHEIKNPLTPMKLNLQYLLHVMENQPGDFKEKFEKTSQGIIEQIDSLASIANEFSNFARLPGAKLQTINLAEIIKTSLRIFENQDNITIQNNITENELLVRGDRDQCLRVFNNIFKNALQAMEDATNPVITIGAKRVGNDVIISVEDNGCGIDDSKKPFIFSPNFTTKTTGSGLGLAMVKNSMLGFEGDIWFESQKGKGTIFYLRFLAEDSPVS